MRALKAHPSPPLFRTESKKEVRLGEHSSSISINQTEFSGSLKSRRVGDYM